MKVCHLADYLGMKNGSGSNIPPSGARFVHPLSTCCRTHSHELALTCSTSLHIFQMLPKCSASLHDRLFKERFSLVVDRDEINVGALLMNEGLHSLKKESQRRPNSFMPGLGAAAIRETYLNRKDGLISMHVQISAVA